MIWKHVDFSTKTKHALGSPGVRNIYINHTSGDFDDIINEPNTYFAPRTFRKYMCRRATQNERKRSQILYRDCKKLTKSGYAN